MTLTSRDTRQWYACLLYWWWYSSWHIKSTFRPRGVVMTIQRRLTILFLFDVLFLIIIMGVTHWDVIRVISVQELIIMSIATTRATHAIAYNAIFEWLRAPFCTVKPDSCQAGNNVHPKGVGITYIIGELLSCPVCVGTWVSLVLVTLWVTQVGRILVYILAVAGIFEVMHRLIEKWEWEGRQYRVISGSISPDGKENL